MKKVEEYLKKVVTEDNSKYIEELRAFVSKLVPNVVETIKWNMLYYIYYGELCSVEPHKEHINFIIDEINDEEIILLEQLGYDLGKRSIKIGYEEKIPYEEISLIIGRRKNINKETYIMKMKEENRLPVKDTYGNGKAMYKLEGTVLEYYYKDGQLKAKGMYVEGLMEGKWLFYRKDGKIRQEGNFLFGGKHGLWIRYDEIGKVEYKEEFIYGKK